MNFGFSLFYNKLFFNINMFKLAALTLGTKVLSAVVSFVLIIAISRLLGAEERGYCSLYLVIISCIMVISDFAGGAASAFLLNTFNPRQLLKVQMVWSILPSILVPVLFFLAKQTDSTETLILIGAGYIHSGWSMQQHLWLGLRRFTIFNTFIMAAPILSTLLFLFIWWLGMHNKMAYLLAISLSWLICYGISSAIFWSSASITGKTGKGFRQIFSAGSLNQLAHVGGLINSRMIFFLIPAGALGVYSNALTLAEACFMVPGSLGQVLYSLAASQTQSAKQFTVLRICWWLNMAIMLLGSVILFVFPSSWFQSIFGADFGDISIYIKYLVPGILFHSIFLLLTYWQSAHGRFKNNLRALLIGLVVNSLATAILWSIGLYNTQSGAVSLTLGWIAASVTAFFIFKVTGGGFAILKPIPGIKTVISFVKARYIQKTGNSQ